MKLSDALTVLNIVPAVIAKAPEFIALVQAAASALTSDDQDVLKEALSDAQEASDAAHERLQAKLAAAT